MTAKPRLYVDPSDVSGAMRDASTASSALTARAGGGQGSATALPSAFNRVTTVATAGDSVKLPAAVAGAMIVVRNGTATSMDVFPQTGQSINALAANTALAVAANTTAFFVSTVTGKWDSLI